MIKKFIITFAILLLSFISSNFISAQVPTLQNLFNLDANTVALWRFNDLSGNVVTDETGINNGTAIGTSIVDGKFGKARYFNGQTDYITVPDNSSLRSFSQLTIEAWVYPTGFDLSCWANAEDIVSKGVDGNLGFIGGYHLRISRNQDGLCAEAGSFNNVNFSGIWHDPNQWYYVVFTYDGSYSKIYVNGVLESSSYTPNLAFITTYPLYINHHLFGGGYQSSQRMRGLIDEIRISNIARSVEEIAYYYNQAVPPPNQPPTILNFNQYKSDSTTQIQENDIIQESTVVFKVALTDSDDDQVKLQVEFKEKNQSFNEQNLIESEFVSSGSEAVISRQSLVDGQYHWRARAVDDKDNASEWQEFGTAGNIDFEVKLVPLYTQVRSPYPSDDETKIWETLPYAEGLAGNYGCGATIKECGCAITSVVMIARYYLYPDIAHGKDVNPKEINEWLQNEPGGYINGDVNWIAAAKYTDWRIQYEKTDKTTNNYALLNEKLDNNQPVIAKENAGRGGINRQHFLIIDNKLAITYGVKDPTWYNTKTLKETTDSINRVRGYENGFDGLRIYKKGDGIAQSSITFALGLPAELLITDPQGRKLGKNKNGIEYNEIPEAWYFEDGFDDPTEQNQPSLNKNKLIYILEPLNGEYKLEVIGTGAGGYTLQSTSYDIQGNSQNQEFHSETALNYTAQYNFFYDSSNSTNIAIELFDETPPEAIIFFDQTTQKLNIQGTDNTTVNPIVSLVEQNKETIYQIKDEKGNLTKLFFGKLKQESKEIKAELKAVQYNNEPIIELPKTELEYEWSLNRKTNTIKELEQRIKVEDVFDIKIKYNHQKDETKIKIKQENKEEIEQTLPGLVVVKLISKSGVLNFQY